jgi:hypothetical protein
MPPKKPMTNDDRAERVRQEGKRGIIAVSREQLDSMGRKELLEIWKMINFQIYKEWEEFSTQELMYYGYCSLFAPLKMSEESPTYTMRVTLEEPEPLIELFERRKNDNSNV